MSVVGFERSLPVILKFEGGNVDDPRDPGGRTSRGITRRVYDAYRRRKNLPVQDVYKATDAEVADIYRAQYWNAVQGDRLPDGVDLVVFDGAVNSGPIASIKWLQRALNVEVDGHLGLMTFDALNEVTDNDQLVADIIANREAFLKSLKTFKTFGKGWLSRTLQVERMGQAWATGRAENAPLAVHTETMNVRAEPAELKKAPPIAVADAATGGGLGSIGLGGVVQQLQDQLTPFSMAGGWIAKLVIALIIIGALLAIGGLVWRFYAKWKQRRLEEAAT